MTGPPPLPLDKTRATAYAGLNLLGMPGLGTYLAGQRLTGLAQAALGLAGFGLIVWWVILFFLQWMREENFPAGGGADWKLGLLGLALAGAAWLWALVTSLQILRAARKTKA